MWREPLRLANPPVVEVGIDFQFEPNPEKQPWDLPVAIPFVERFKDCLPHVQIVQAEEIRIEKRSPQGRPEKLSGKISLDHVKAHDECEKQWLEVGNDRMAYRLRRGGNEYPGFEAVLEEAVKLLSQYMDHFRPTAVRRAILTYVDIIRIPSGAEAGIDLDDFFRLGVKLPEDPFGPLGGFAIRFVLPQSPCADSLQVRFVTEPETEKGSMRFRMHWQSLCDGINSLDEEKLRQRLSAAREHLVKCFMACFTEQGLKLFNPIGSD